MNRLIQGIRVLRVRMLRMLEPVNIALAGSDCAMLRQVGAAMRPGMSAGEAWLAYRKQAGRSGVDVLAGEDCVVLDQLFAQLGESGREQQSILLDSTVTALGKNLLQAEKRLRETERLYVSVGMMVGLILALAVI